MNPFERVMIFIDGSNVFKSIKNYNRENQQEFKIDYFKLIDFLTNGRNLIRPYYYGSEDVPPNQSQTNYLNKLRFSGFEVVSKPLRSHTDKDGVLFKIEKGVDVSLATDFISLAWENAFDTAIIVSGDSDYIEAIKRVKQKGKKVEVVAFQNAIGSDLKMTGDKTILLDDITKDISL